MDTASSDILTAAGRWEGRESWQRQRISESERETETERHRKVETETDRGTVRDKLMVQNFHLHGAKVDQTQA